MIFYKLIKNIISSVIDISYVFLSNIYTYFIHCPMIAKDIIMKGYSLDLNNWVISNPLPVVKYLGNPFLRKMEYYTFENSFNKRIYHLMQIQSPLSRKWRTYIYDNTCKKVICKTQYGVQITSPQVVGDIFYCLLKKKETKVAIYSSPLNLVVNKNIKDCVSLRMKKEQIPLLKEIGTIEDFNIIYKNKSTLYIFFSAFKESNKIFIYKMTKINNKWKKPCRALNWKENDLNYFCTNNVNVVKIENNEYRMYFRSSPQPAINSCIYYARSTDLNKWVINDIPVITPGTTKWSTHGVAFPFVRKSPTDNFWEIYFAGYWGDGIGGKRAAVRWQENYDSSLIS